VKRQKVLRFSPEEGLYFSRIFVPLVSSQVLQKLKDSGLEAQKELMNSKKFPFESWKIHDCLHISLSREFVLQKHYVDSFKNLLEKELSSVISFRISLTDETSVLVNDSKSRSFVALNVNGGVAALKSLVDKVDSVLSRFSFPSYYDNRVFHASVASVAGDATMTKKPGIQASGSILEMGVHVRKVHLGIGTIGYDFPLKDC
jgi:hypothetical protein